MDYCSYLPPITLRKVFDKERSPSPSDSEITARQVFDFETIPITSSSLGGSDGPQVPTTDRDEQGRIFPDNIKFGNSPSSVVTPPPRGPLSKPNGGGYALRDALGWEEGVYRSVQIGLHAVCEKHLDMNYRFHNQTPEALTQYFRAASAQYPILNGYQDLWPARDFARIYLKNKVGQDKVKSKTSGSK